MTQPVYDALRDVGWTGDFVCEETADRVHVRWNGRHVEAVSLEAAAAFILADARAKAAEAAGDTGPATGEGDDD